MGKKKDSQKEKTAKGNYEKIIIWSIIVLLLFIFIPIGINILVSIPNPIVKGDPNTVEATWINFWGSYSGGFLSALIGAFVAYHLIGTQAEANRNSQTLQEISLAFNREFQNVKQHIVQNTTQMHTLIQLYNMQRLSQFQFLKDYDELMKQLQLIQTEFLTVINSNVVLLQYVAEKSADFSYENINRQLTYYALNCDSLMKKREEFAVLGKNFDAVKLFNTDCLPPINALRRELVKFEYGFVNILFPVLITSKKFSLPVLEAVEETDHDTAVEKMLGKLQ